MRDYDALISCVPYSHNLQLAPAAIEARANFCDLGGNNAIVDAELALDAQAREVGVNIIPDCGLAPGMVSILVAHGIERFDRVHDVRIRVGGLPQDSIIAQMMARGDIEKKGAIAHEHCMPAEIFLDELKVRGIEIQESVEREWNGCDWQLTARYHRLSVGGGFAST